MDIICLKDDYKQTLISRVLLENMIIIFETYNLIEMNRNCI